MIPDDADETDVEVVEVDVAAGEVSTVEVVGLGVDEETRCAHYSSERDVVAIEFACCGTYYPCFRCHRTVADHPAEVWGRDERDERAVLCGACGTELTIDAYLECEAACPDCGAAFNPGCAEHSHHYFAV